jgi:T4 bacteriophage base plate protein
MAIPKIDLPTYKLEIKSIGKEITFRPFVVKEEKILLMALESRDYETSLDAIKQIVRNCVLDELDVESLPLYEIEFLFLNLRARSIGEIVSLQYVCENVIDGKKRCKSKMDLEVDLLKVAVDHKPLDNSIVLSNGVGIKLNYPTISVSKVLIEKLSTKDAPVEILKQCTEYLYDENQVYKIDEMQPGEFEEFVNNLTTEQYRKIKNFFMNMPILRYENELVCGKCNKKHTIKLEGLLDFFV